MRRTGSVRREPWHPRLAGCCFSEGFDSAGSGGRASLHRLVPAFTINLHQRRYEKSPLAPAATSGLYFLLHTSPPPCYPGRYAYRRLEVSGVKCFWPTFLL